MLAAASLTEPFTALAEAYEADHPGATVRLSFGSSTTLAQQVAQGADADLLATAGTAALDQLGTSVPTATTTIARNTLEIATPADNPGRVAALADLARDGRRRRAVRRRASPAAAAADEVLARAGVAAHVVSREVDVTATLAKVTLGEADAAVVYHSDVVSAGDAVAASRSPPRRTRPWTYPLAWFGDEPRRPFAGSWQPEGVAALTASGFLAP